MVPLLFLASLVNDVRGALAQRDFVSAERQVRAYKTSAGVTPELAAAVSWIARSELDARNYTQADAYATETRKLCDTLLRSRKVDAEPLLPTALGASIEVHALTVAAGGGRSEAIAFLDDQSKRFAATSVIERIHKNINLLSLEGKPAPELSVAEWLGPKPRTLASLRGHPVLLFFWAHWCADCKAEEPLLADLERVYARKGLVIIGPTRRYGYVANGDDASPVVEKEYIEKIRQQFYAGLIDVAVPVSAANFKAYGASTTPTIVLIDGAGIVRLYHPGALQEADLATRIQAVLQK